MAGTDDKKQQQSAEKKKAAGEKKQSAAKHQPAAKQQPGNFTLTTILHVVVADLRFSLTAKLCRWKEEGSEERDWIRSYQSEGWEFRRVVFWGTICVNLLSSLYFDLICFWSKLFILIWLLCMMCLTFDSSFRLLLMEKWLSTMIFLVAIFLDLGQWQSGRFCKYVS